MRIFDDRLEARDETRVPVEWVAVAALGGFALGMAAAYVFCRPPEVEQLPRHRAAVPSASEVAPGVAGDGSGNDQASATVSEEAGAESPEA